MRVSRGRAVKFEDEARMINMISQVKEWMTIGSGDITLDSAAEESVCPKDWHER